MIILHSAQVPVAWPESNCTPEEGANAYFQSTMSVVVDTKKGAEAPWLVSWIEAAWILVVCHLEDSIDAPAGEAHKASKADQ